MYNCNLDEAVKHVKTIVDNNRCVVCDQLNVSFIRYPCGHSTCSSCVETAEDCLVCLTPPDASAHFVDEPSSKRVRNASELLIAFQELFQIDVYRRHRVSEKLKLEKQFFPECIQASTKYFNKRKSLNTTEKENKQKKRFSSLPGENISSNKISTMENTVNYVEKWLNKNESVQKAHKNLPRKPFTDLNVNQTNNKDANNVGFQNSIKKSLGQKRTHLKIIKDTSNVPKVSYKRIKNDTTIKKYGVQDENKKNKRISENNESGIFVDEIIDIDDTQCEIINLDDSPSEIVDKDRLALLEILQAEENNDSACGIEPSMIENEMRSKDNFNEPNKSEETLKTYKVPFFKRSNLFDVNVNTDKFKDMTKTTPTSKNITVTIDNNSFVTTIKVSNLGEGASCSRKQSTSVQTDNNISDAAIIPDKIELNEPTKVINEEVTEIKSIKSNSNQQTNKRKCLIIEESDTDSDLTDDNINSLEVTADIHQYIDNGILCELDQNVYEHRAKHAAREHTPLSTDSSDKENYDPNRIKRQKTEKKNCYKK